MHATTQMNPGNMPSEINHRNKYGMNACMCYPEQANSEIESRIVVNRNWG